MKMLHILLNYEPSQGGNQIHFKEVSERLVSCYGDEVEVWTFNSLLNPARRDPVLIPRGVERMNGVLVRRFPFSTKVRRVLNRSAQLASQHTGVQLPDQAQLFLRGPIAPRLVAHALTTDADVVLAAPLGYMTCPYAQLVARARNIPVGVMGALHLKSPDDLHVKHLRTISRVARYMALTQFEASTLVSHGVDRDRIEVIGPGVDVGVISGGDGARLRVRFGWGANDCVFAFVGRQVPYKGPQELLRAACQVWDSGNDNVRVIIAGGRTDFSAKLRAIVDVMPIEHRARVGFVDDFDRSDARDIYAASDVVVSVSSEESFGIVYLEAWAAGRPVIGGDIPAIRDVITHGEDGMIVPCADVRALAAAMEHLGGSPSERQRMGASGRARVLKSNTWDHVTQRWREMYRGMIASHRAA